MSNLIVAFCDFAKARNKGERMRPNYFVVYTFPNLFSRCVSSLLVLLFGFCSSSSSSTSDGDGGGGSTYIEGFP